MGEALITRKGYALKKGANATPDKMLKGYGAYVGKNLIQGTLNLKEEIKLSVEPPFPSLPSSGRAHILEYNGEIHCLQGNNHYKLIHNNMTTWERLGSFELGECLVLATQDYSGDNVIYAIASNNREGTFKNGKWTYKDVINDIRSISESAITKYTNSRLYYTYYDTSDNTYRLVYAVTIGLHSLRTIPYSFVNGSIIQYNKYLHLLGGTSSPRSHYIVDYGDSHFNEPTFTKLKDLPFDFYHGKAECIDDKLFLIGGQERRNHVAIFDNDTLIRDYASDEFSQYDYSVSNYNPLKIDDVIYDMDNQYNLKQIAEKNFTKTIG